MLSKVKINKLLWALLLVLLLAVAFIYTSLKVVPANNAGLVLQKNKFVALAPGAHWVAPFTQVILVPVNERMSAVTGLTNADGSTENISVLWQVADINKFWQATHNDSVRVKALLHTALLAAKNYNIGQDANVLAAGISVNQVLVTGQSLSDVQLQATYQKMQGLASTLAAGILADGNKEAASIRAEGDQDLINIAGQAMSQATQVVAEGQVQALQITAPLYHKNPELFKLIVDTKAKMLQQN